MRQSKLPLRPTTQEAPLAPSKPTTGIIAGRKSRAGQLRLIGGRFGGRRLPIPDQPGLRPTSDRTRETLFNWLQPIITGSRCLDAFAGSGALGFEALSRGAAHVMMLEQNAKVAHQLKVNAIRLGVKTAAHSPEQIGRHGKSLHTCGGELLGSTEFKAGYQTGSPAPLNIQTTNSLHWLANADPTPFDIVFLDPPFADRLLPASLEALGARCWLTPAARIYLETDAHSPFPALPPAWSLLREKTAGGVRFGLVLAGA